MTSIGLEGVGVKVVTTTYVEVGRWVHVPRAGFVGCKRAPGSEQGKQSEVGACEGDEVDGFNDIGVEP